MPFFQNVFKSDWSGHMPLADRQYVLTFTCPGNAGRGDEIVTAWKLPSPTYNFSGNDAEGDAKNILNIYFAIDPDFKNWSLLAVNVTTGAGSASAETIYEVVEALNDNVEFACWFTATVNNDRIIVRQKKPVTNMKFYVANGQAETVLGFNARAGVAELPSYLSKHTIANRFAYPDGHGAIIQLDTTNLVDAAVINDAQDYRGVDLGYSSSTVQADWQLLNGNSGLFIFKKQTVDGSSRITQIIEYAAGAGVGSPAKKTIMTYTAAQTQPDKIVEIPYVLQSGDLVTP